MSETAIYDEVYNRFVDEVHTRSNKLIEIFLLGYFLFGIGVSFFYDTWMIGLSVGGLVMLAYYLAKMMFPKSTLRQYVVSAGFAIFMGQFIYQMHGMFEMHFFAFIGATLLIAYQNWKSLIPLAVIIVLHHAVFGYMQYASFTANSENSVYFSQLDYMDAQTFIIHCSLAVVIIVVCAVWSHDLNKRTINNTKNIVEIEKISSRMAKNMEYAALLANGMEDEIVEPIDENDMMGNALKAIHLKLTKQ